jgi:hypothetical protein
MSDHDSEIQSAEQVADTGLDDPLLRLICRDLHQSERSSEVAGPVVARLIGITDAGVPLVVTPLSGPASLTALSTVDLTRSHIGMQVLLVFEGNDARRPIIVGVLRGAGAWSALPAPGRVEVDVDGQRMVVSAKHELVLRCGRASITLDSEGKVTIRGTQVVSHASGVNRIRGGSVQLN